MLGLKNDLSDSSFILASPRLDPTICMCNCHGSESDLSSAKKLQMVRHIQPCCTGCSICGARVMIGMVELHQRSYCIQSSFGK